MQKVEAFILDKYPRGEADEVLVCYTKERGKMLFLARGLKKHKSKLRGSLQNYNWAYIHFIEGRTLAIVTDVSLKKSFSSLKKSPEKVRSIKTITNFLNKSFPQGGSDHLLWWQLIKCAAALDDLELDEEILGIIPVFFIYKMLSMHGFRPELNNCVSCRDEIIPGKKNWFSSPMGGMIDNKCVHLDTTAYSVKDKTLETLKDWQVRTLDSFISQGFPVQNQSEITKMIEQFTSWHLGTPLGFTQFSEV